MTPAFMSVSLSSRFYVRTLLAILLACFLQVGCSSQPEEQIVDVTGTTHSPLHGESGDVVVIVFSSTDCPIANAMAPDLERANKETLKNGGRFYLVHARKDLQDATAVKHASEYSLSMPVLIDHDHDGIHRHSPLKVVEGIGQNVSTSNVRVNISCVFS